MAEIIKRNKALSVNPLKSSQSIGGALAFLGFRSAIPMLHGSQGCTAFGKVFFVRHFREPIPLQTTAMDQVTTVMGSDESVVEGLRTICEKSAPALIGVPTTGLTETQGSDVMLALHQFRDRYPHYAHIPVVPVATPDYVGSLESGFAAATAAIIDQLVPSAAQAGSRPGRRQRQLNIIPSALLTPGDLEELKQLVELFGLRPLVLPDIGDSLDGHLDTSDFSTLTIGGCDVGECATLGDSCATLVIGASQRRAGERLRDKSGVPLYLFNHLMGLAAVDELVMLLAELSGNPVPPQLERQRAQLQDAMLDSHFMIGMARIAIAGDADLLHAFAELLVGMGAEVVAAVASTNAPILQQLPCAEVKIGDLEELERLAREGRAELLISNSHAVETAKRLEIPLLRAGFPQYDLVGGYARTWIGYRGSRQALFDIANLLIECERGEIEPYVSRYSHTVSPVTQEVHHVAAKTSESDRLH